jgi:hypothetical protein
LCHLHHKLIGFYNRDEKCLQRGTDWVFKYSGLRFVFKGLNALALLSLPPHKFELCHIFNTVLNSKLCRRGVLQWHNIYDKRRAICSNYSKFGMTNTSGIAASCSQSCYLVLSQTCEKRLLASCLSVRPRKNNSAPIGRIFMKLDI